MLVIYRWKGLQNNFPRVYYSPGIFFGISAGKSRKQICNHLATAEHAGQKSHDWKTSAVLFSQRFLLVQSLPMAVWPHDNVMDTTYGEE